MKHYVLRMCCLLLPAVLLSPATSSAQLSANREPGAVYLEDMVDKKVTIPVNQPTNIYYDITLGRYLGTLRIGQQLEVQAIADHAYRVRGNAQQGQVVGWVPVDSLTQLKPEFVAAMKKASERLNKVKALIAKNEVAMGMTGEEVLLSLGKPQKKSTRVDADGRQEVWDYITYKTVPQEQPYVDAYNRVFNRTIYVKVPDGQMSVIMKDNVVSAIEEAQGNLVGGGGARIVVPPIEINY